MQNKNNNLIFKYIIVGNSGVGKTALLFQYIDKRFSSLHDMTIGVDFGTKIIERNNRTIKLQIWDTAGQENFRSITRAFYRGAIGALLVFDVTNSQSFEQLSSWLDDVQKYSMNYINIVLIGNKCDLPDYREISKDQAENFAKKHNLTYFEVSAKTGQNIDDVFSCISDSIINDINAGIINSSLYSAYNDKTLIKENTQTKQNNQCYC